MKNLVIILVISSSFALGFFLGRNEAKTIVEIREAPVMEATVHAIEAVDEKRKTNQKVNKGEGKKKVKLKGKRSKMNKILIDADKRLEVERECELGSREHCHRWREYLRYSGQADKLKKFFQAKCFDEDFDSCQDLLFNSNNKDRKKLKRFLFKACNQNKGEACSLYGTLIDWRVPTKDVLAVKYKACELNETNCTNYAYYLKRIGHKDTDLYMERGCLASDNESHNCYSAYDYYASKGDMANAIRVAGVGCDKGDSSSCNNLYKTFLATGKLDMASRLKKEKCAENPGKYWGLDCPNQK